MAQSTSTAKGTNGSNADTADLSAQIAQLKTDLAKIAGTVGDIAKDRGRAAQSAVSTAVSDLGSQGRDLAVGALGEARQLEARAAGAIRERPLTAIALAAGAGLLVGMLSSRK